MASSTLDQTVRPDSVAEGYHVLCSFRISLASSFPNNWIKNGSILTLRRDSNNFYDENAVEVFFRDTKLGYIPREVNEEVSCYLNLSNEYTLTVHTVNVIDLNKFIEVNIRLSFEK